MCERDESYDELVTRLETTYGTAARGGIVCASAPGRSELAGNHTDHEGGHVLACAVNRYVRGVFRPNGTSFVRLTSEGFAPLEVDLGALEPRTEERGSTTALVRGLAACLCEAGAEPAGFDAYVTSEVPAGSGLSSSAAFELLVARAMSELWLDVSLAPERLALMAQRAERAWFGKPCGLMDQASIALGGIQHLSFADPKALVSERIDFDFAEAGYALCLVAVGADHADLVDEYAAVPGEMQEVAQFCGSDLLGGVLEVNFAEQLPDLREECGDRAVLRALHFFREERLVARRVAALRAADMGEFLRLTRLSGASSAMYLQNVSLWGREQSAMVALAIADEMLGDDGAARIHGGGFGGTIQAFVPLGKAEAFSTGMDFVFGAGSCGVYQVESEGARSWRA